jgi:hypothetical protein
MPFMKFDRNEVAGAAVLVVALVLALSASACSSKSSGANGSAPRGIPSGLPAAAPRALGPGAASLEAPSRTAPRPSDDDDDPFAPFAEPPEGGIALPPSEPLPL